MDFTRFDEIVQSINDKAGTFLQVGAIRDWSHRIAEGIEAPCDELFAGESQTANAGFTWSSAGGNAWFWKEVTLPEEVNGVSLAGSPVDFIFCLPIGCTLFLNGKQIFHEPFWSDTRSVELRITDNCKPGEKLQFVIKAKSGDGFGLLLETLLRVGSIDKAQYEVETFREQLKFCRYLMEKDAKNDPALQQVLSDAVNLVDVTALKANHWDQWKSSVAATVDKLAPFNERAKEFEVYMMAHSHIDMNWLWPWSETVDVCKRDFTSMDSLMKRFPDFHFSQSQVSVYKAMQDYHPEVFERIKERVEQGNWEVTASTWVEGDLNAAMGETLVR